MKAVGASALGHLADLGPLCMRVGVGAVFAVHGWQKFDQIGVSNFAGFLESLNVPAPEAALIGLLEPVLNPLWVWLVHGEVPAPASLAGGAMLLGGLAVRYAPRPRPPGPPDR